MTFLPEKYQVPQSSGKFMKLEQGDNVFRILSSAVVGWEYWNKENKPIRSKEPFTKIPDDIKLDKEGNPTKAKHFWAFIVWDYKDNTIKALQITQASIQKAIKGYVDDPDWGDPKKYDFAVTRSGEGLETEYNIRTKPQKELSADIQKAYEAEQINLDRVYDGESPFGAETHAEPQEYNADDEILIDELPS